MFKWSTLNDTPSVGHIGCCVVIYCATISLFNIKFIYIVCATVACSRLNFVRVKNNYFTITANVYDN